MALITVMSAKGAPGATTTAMLLASLWPRPSILVDADPLGGDIALRLPRADGRAFDRERGLLSLLPAARRGLLPEMVTQHTQIALGGQPVVAGLDGPEQSAAVTPLWPALADAFANVPGTDVIVDAGQVHQRSPHLALVERSDVVLWVYRPTAWSALHTRRRLEGLADQLADSPTRTGVVAVATAEQETDAESATRAILGEWTWVLSYDAVAHDPRAVVMFEGGQVHRPERTLLARSGATLAEQLFAEAQRGAPSVEDPGVAGDAVEETGADLADRAAEDGAPDADSGDVVPPGAERDSRKRGRRRGQRRAGRGERAS